MCHRISLDRAGFEPRRVEAFVPDIANTGPARKSNQLSIGWPDSLRRSAASTDGSNPARIRFICMVRPWGAEIFALPFVLFGVLSRLFLSSLTLLNVSDEPKV